MNVALSRGGRRCVRLQEGQDRGCRLLRLLQRHHVSDARQFDERDPIAQFLLEQTTILGRCNQVVDALHDEKSCASGWRPPLSQLWNRAARPGSGKDTGLELLPDSCCVRWRPGEPGYTHCLDEIRFGGLSVDLR